MAAQEKSIAFGIGCFVFEVIPADGQTEFKLEWWQEALLEALGSISSISDVRVEVDFDQLVSDSWKFTQDDDLSPELQEFLPDPRGSSVSFEINIPKRLHPRLIDGHTLAGELFRVETHYRFFGPATIVSCLDAGPDGDGSLAVRLLWRFLEEEFKKHTKQLKFTLLGPSPFHARFLLKQGLDAQEVPLTWSELSRQGYANIELTYSGEFFDDLSEAFTYVCHLLTSEASLFYSVTRVGNYELLISRYLAVKTNELMRMHSQRGFRAGCARLFRSGARARELGLDALSYKLLIENNATVVRDSILDVYGDSSTIGLLRTDLDRIAIGSLPETNSALDVVTFAESGRSKEFEVAVVSASTLLGGIAGAIAAIVAGA